MPLLYLYLYLHNFLFNFQFESHSRKSVECTGRIAFVQCENVYDKFGKAFRQNVGNLFATRRSSALDRLVIATVLRICALCYVYVIAF